MGLAFIVRGLRCLGLYTYLSVIIYACLGFHLLTFCQSCLGWVGLDRYCHFGRSGFIELVVVGL